MKILARTILALLPLAIGACNSTETQLLVVVTSDYLVPGELHEIRASVRRDTGDPLAEHSFPISAQNEGGAFQLPISFGVLPIWGDASQPVNIAVEALPPAGDTAMSTRTAATGFIDGRALMLPMFLSRTCRDQACAPGLTCSDRGCVSEVVDPGTLETFEAGDERDVTNPTAPDGGTPTTHLLNVFKTGTGNGRIVSNTQLIDCGTSCAAEIPPRQAMTLTAMPDASSELVGWSGDCTGTLPSCTFPMNSPKNITAEFRLKENYLPLTVNMGGDGRGRVTADLGMIDCGTICTDGYEQGIMVVLTATPELGSIFEGWTGACFGANPCRVTMNVVQTVTATFRSNNASIRHLSVYLSGSGIGHVTTIDGQVNCRVDCDADYPEGTVVSLTATPDPPYVFAGWSGPCSGNTACNVTMDRAQTVGAIFTPVGQALHHLTVTRSGRGSGTVRSVPGIECGPDCDEDYAASTPVSLEAIAAPGSRFAGWSNTSCPTQSGPCSVTMFSSQQIDAKFEPIFSSRFDLDGDQRDDAVFAASGYDVNGQLDSGRIYFVRGGSSSLDISASDADNYWDGPTSGARLGASFALPGDMTGDGIADLAIGAPGIDSGRGAVIIIPGGVLPASGPLPAPGISIPGSRTGDRFGASVSGAGDFNGDGYADLVVGAPGDVTRTGMMHLVLGGPGLFNGTGPTPLVFEGESVGDNFGDDVAGGRDINGDNYDDILVGAPGWDGVQKPNAGRGYIFFGGVPAMGRGGASANIILSGNTSNGAVGASVALIGDWNFDGTGDFALGSPTQDKVHVFYGSATLGSTDVGAAHATLTALGKFGASLSGPGDITGDGVADLIVGAPDHGGIERGAVFLYPGMSPPSSNFSATLSGGCFDLGLCDREVFGSGVAAAGDFDGNGVRDIAVGSSFGGGVSGASNRGRISIFLGGGSFGTMTSEQAPIQITGEDEPNGYCSVVEG